MEAMSTSDRKLTPLEDRAQRIEYRSAVDPLIETAMTLGARLKQMHDAERVAAFDADDAQRRPNHEFVVGDRVVMTGSAIRSMTLRQGLDIKSATMEWSVIECACDLCQTGRFVAVDQTVVLGIDESGADELGWRHFAKQALRLRGQPIAEEFAHVSKVYAR